MDKHTSKSKVTARMLCIVFSSLLLCSVGFAQNPTAEKLKEKLPLASDPRSTTNILNQLGAHFEGISEYPQALSYLYQAQQTNRANQFVDEAIFNCNYIGYVYWHKSEYDSALHYHNKAAALADTNRIENENTAFTSLMLGNDYYDKGDFSKASAYYFESLKLAERMDAVDVQIQCNNRLSKLFFKMKDYALCEQYVQEAILLNTADNRREFGVSYNSLGNLSLANKDVDAALYYFEETLAYFQLCGDVIGQSIASINLGDSYLALYAKTDSAAALDESYLHYEHSLELNAKVDNKFGMIYGFWGMADVGMRKADYSIALENYRQALAVAVEIGARSEEQNLYNKLHFLFDVQANRDSSLHYLKKHIALKNEVESSKQSKQMLKQESKYEAEKFIAHEQAEAEKQQLIEAAENKWKNIVMTLVIAVALILVYVVIVSVRRLKSTKVKNELIREINDELHYQKKEITDSISYARRIQNAILPSPDMIAEFLPNSFVYYNPKDIVAGDFYWMSTPTESAADKVLFAVADCTGHGVPGAMMSVICGNALSSAVKEFDLNSPEQILNKVNTIIQEALRTTADDVRDGMDIALCLWNKATNKLHYSGAFNSFYCCRNGELIILKADRIPVGKYVQTNKTFTLHEMSLQQGDTFYLFTDGYADQFGGVKGKKFKTNALKAMLLSICEQPLAAQKAFLAQHFEEWRGDLEQVDDVCVLGVRV